MTDWLWSPDTLVISAGVVYTIGYLMINQIALRLTILFGSGLWIAYYATVDSEPLWTAIGTSSAQGSAVVVGLILLLARNSRIMIPHRDRDICDRFPELPPGDFRTIMALAKRHHVDEDTVISTEGAPVDQVHYVVEGATRIDKLGESFRMPSGWFVGEVAYLTGRPSVATTTVFAGAELLTWDVKALRAKTSRNSRFGLAFEAMISKNLALKVSYAVAPKSLTATRLDVDAVEGDAAGPTPAG